MLDKTQATSNSQQHTHNCKWRMRVACRVLSVAPHCIRVKYIEFFLARTFYICSDSASCCCCLYTLTAFSFIVHRFSCILHIKRFGWVFQHTHTHTTIPKLNEIKWQIQKCLLNEYLKKVFFFRVISFVLMIVSQSMDNWKFHSIILCYRSILVIFFLKKFLFYVQCSK